MIHRCQRVAWRRLRLSQRPGSQGCLSFLGGWQKNPPRLGRRQPVLRANVGAGPSSVPSCRQVSAGPSTTIDGACVVTAALRLNRIFAT